MRDVPSLRIPSSRDSRCGVGERREEQTRLLASAAEQKNAKGARARARPPPSTLPLKMRNAIGTVNSVPLACACTRHSRRCKCQSRGAHRGEVEKRPPRGRESTNLDAAVPRGRLTRSKMTPAFAGRGDEAGRARGGYKGLESRLVDEGDKKFIRRSVGAAPPPPRRWRREQRKRKNEANDGEEEEEGEQEEEGGARNKVAIHLAKRAR